jgi:hypothetical protein
MGVRARFYIASITQTISGHTVRLQAVSRGEHNKNWSKWTPSGTLELTINNDDAMPFFQKIMDQARNPQEGKAYFPEVYIDITEADQPE